jgi:hypothetical protein
LSDAHITGFEGEYGVVGDGNGNCWEVFGASGPKWVDSAEMVAGSTGSARRGSDTTHFTEFAHRYVSNVCACIAACCEDLFAFASSRGVAEDGERMVVRLCDQLTISLTALAAQLYARVTVAGESECVEMLGAEVDRRLAVVRVRGDENDVERVMDALSDLSAFVVLASAGLSLRGGGEGIGGRAGVGYVEGWCPRRSKRCPVC